MSPEAAIVGTPVLGIGASSPRRFARWITPALAFVLATFVLMAPLHAQGHGGGGHGGGGGWHGGGWHGGGHGSVFFNFGLAAPYYPYYYAPYPYYYPPAYYAPPAYYPPAAAPSAPGPSAALAQSWYYCDNPQGYYPYVESCAGGWRQVPSQPQ